MGTREHTNTNPNPTLTLTLTLTLALTRHKAEITWHVAEERCRDIELFGAGARLAEPRTADQVPHLPPKPKP